MLGKLMKYDIKAAAKTFLPFYAALLVLAVLNRFCMPFNDDITFLSGLAVFGYAIAVLAVLVVTIIVIIQRYYRNIVKDEAYLMFTLPVKPWQLIAGKVITSIMWAIASFVTIICSVAILVLRRDYMASIRQGLTIAHSYIEQFFSSTGLFYTELIVVMIAYCTLMILILYTAVTIGSLFRNKILGSFLGFLIVYAAVEICNLILVVVLHLNNADVYQSMLLSNMLPQTVGIVYVGYTLLLSAGCFAVSNYILNKHLNLE